MIDQIKSLIITSVKEHWDREGKALLLSTLGTQIAQKFPESKSLMDKGLRRFLIDWPIVRVVSHPKIIQKVGAIPLDVKVPEEITDLFSEKFVEGDQDHNPPRIYDQTFWNIFVYGFADSQFIIVNESKGWRLGGEQSNAEGDSSYEILRSDIVSMPRETPMHEKVNAVHAAINSWLQRNGLNRSIFARRVQVEKEISRLDSFGAALSALDSVDLARISVPLDIVKKILSSRR